MVGPIPNPDLMDTYVEGPLQGMVEEEIASVEKPNEEASAEIPNEEASAEDEVSSMEASSYIYSIAT